MTEASLRIKAEQIKSKREVLVRLLKSPNIGNLELDVNQALEELDELISELDQTL